MIRDCGCLWPYHRQVGEREAVVYGPDLGLRERRVRVRIVIHECAVCGDRWERGIRVIGAAPRDAPYEKLAPFGSRIVTVMG